MHGKQTNTNTFTSYAAARNYWINGSHDAVKTATKNFAASYYVVGYNGTQPWWGQPVGRRGRERDRRRHERRRRRRRACVLRARTRNGGTFWVIGHSMAGPIMDYILGNNDPSDPNFNAVGPFDQSSRSGVSLVITLGGAHRGSQGADAVCGNNNFFCNFIALFIQSCDTATYWLRSADDVQVRTYAERAARATST